MSVIKECIRRFREEVPKPKETRIDLNEESFWWIRSSSEQESLCKLNNTECSTDTNIGNTGGVITKNVPINRIYVDEFVDQIYDISQDSCAEDIKDYQVNDNGVVFNSSYAKDKKDYVATDDIYFNYDENDFNHVGNSNHLKFFKFTDNTTTLDQLDEYASDLLLQCDHFLAFNANGSNDSGRYFNDENNGNNNIDREDIKSSIVSNIIPNFEIDGKTIFEGCDNKIIEFQDQLSKEVQTEYEVDNCQIYDILDIKQSIDVPSLHNRVKSTVKSFEVNCSIESNDVFYLSSVENSVETLHNVLKPKMEMLENIQAPKESATNLLANPEIPLNTDETNRSIISDFAAINNELILKETINVDNVITTISCDSESICDVVDETNICMFEKNPIIESSVYNENSLESCIDIFSLPNCKVVDIKPTVVEVKDQNLYIDPLTGIDLRGFLTNPVINNLWHRVITKND